MTHDNEKSNGNSS